MIVLKKTCNACPEQYDAFLDGKMVGYLRLRHGSFTVQCPGYDGRLVYSATPRGDGIFEHDERDFYLRHAVKAIEDWNAGREPEAPNVQYKIEELYSADEID